MKTKLWTYLENPEEKKLVENGQEAIYRHLQYRRKYSGQ